MSADTVDIHKYLRRINYSGELSTGLELLRELQQHHLLSVPFENLDIHYGNPISLDFDKFYSKIVGRNRGGFCYELNGLFFHLLKNVGFDAKIISARVYDQMKNTFGPEFDHLAVIVSIGQDRFLADVGFGEFAFHPLKIETDVVQADRRGDFLIERLENNRYMVSKLSNGTKSIEYLFTEEERNLNEFSGMCNYHQTSPDSNFTKKKIVSRPTINGRITITGNTLKIIENKSIITESEFEEEDFGNKLQQWFDIDLRSILPKP